MMSWWIVLVMPVALCSLSVDPSELYTLEVLDTTLEDGLGIFGGSANGGFGTSIENVGDINGDGLDDIVIGEPGYDGNKGRAIVVFGNETDLPSMMADRAGESPYGFSVTTSIENSSLGYSVSGGGDYNGDGINDIIVGAYGNSTVVVLWGRSENTWSGIDIDTDMTSTIGIKITGEQSGSQFGFALANLGDFNNDTFDDFVIGAPLANDMGEGSVGVNQGVIYMVFGEETGTSRSDFTASAETTLTIAGDTSNEKFGRLMSYGGDINGDSVHDAVFSNELRNNGAGVYYAVYGNSTYGVGSMNTQAFVDGVNAEFIEAGTDYSLGSSVSGGCDFNKDSIHDYFFAMDVQYYLILLIAGNSTSSFSLIDVHGGLSVNSVNCLKDLDGDEYDDILLSFSSGDSLVVYGMDIGESILTDLSLMESEKIRSVLINGSTTASDTGNFQSSELQAIAIVDKDVQIGTNEGAGAVYVVKNFPVPPEITDSPTSSPTSSPTVSTTETPTVSPTESATMSPTESPTVSASESPTMSSTESPTASLSESPTMSPTESPTVTSTESPTATITESPTVSPTKNPTVSSTESPSSTPTSSPTMGQCEVTVSTTGGDGITWDVTDGEGDEEIASGEFGGDDMAFILSSSEEYLLFLSSSTVPAGTTITVTINGDETTIPLDGVSSASEIAGLTCESITDKIASIDSGFTVATASGLLSLLLTLI